MRCQESEGSPTPWSDSPGTLRNNHNRQREIHARYQAEINPSACSCDGVFVYNKLCENWLRAIEISLPQERQRRSMLTDKMAEENDRNGI